MDKVTENIKKILSMSNDIRIEVGIGLARGAKGKIIVSLEPGWVVEKDSLSGEAGYGDTFEEALDDYMKRVSGKSFQVEEEDKEPYEVKFPF